MNVPIHVQWVRMHYQQVIAWTGRSFRRNPDLEWQAAQPGKAIRSQPVHGPAGRGRGPDGRRQITVGIALHRRDTSGPEPIDHASRIRTTFRQIARSDDPVNSGFGSNRGQYPVERQRETVDVSDDCHFHAVWHLSLSWRMEE